MVSFLFSCTWSFNNTTEFKYCEIVWSPAKVFTKSLVKKIPGKRKAADPSTQDNALTWNSRITVNANMKCIQFPHDSPDLCLSCNTVLTVFSRDGHCPGREVTNTLHICRSVRNPSRDSSKSLFPSWYPSRMSKQSVGPRSVSLRSDTNAFS